MRFKLSSTQIILIYMPFVITGALVSVLALFIFVDLVRIQRKVGKVGMKNKTASDTALLLLIVRLAILGLSTFVVLIVFIATTGTVIEETNSFTSAFNNWFGCTTTAFTWYGAFCARGAKRGLTCRARSDQDTCLVDKTDADAQRPTVAVIALQLACMSTITALFGGFFALQSLSRLYKEFMDGSLGRKVSNICHGRHVMNESAFASGKDDKVSSVQQTNYMPSHGALSAYQVEEDMATGKKSRVSNL